MISNNKSGIMEFIKYWYFRYLLVTELYMVEPWERTVIYSLFVFVFLSFWYFNYSILTSIFPKYLNFAQIFDTENLQQVTQ